MCYGVPYSSKHPLHMDNEIPPEHFGETKEKKSGTNAKKFNIKKKS